MHLIRRAYPHYIICSVLKTEVSYSKLASKCIIQLRRIKLFLAEHLNGVCMELELVYSLGNVILLRIIK